MMKTGEFIGAYEKLEVVRRLDCPLPAVKEEKRGDLVLCFGHRGMGSSGKEISWQETVDYMLKNLRLYLKANWYEMLESSSVADTVRDEECEAYLHAVRCRDMLDFLRRRPNVVLFLGEEVISLLRFVLARVSDCDERCEIILRSPEAENILSSYSFSEKLHENLLALIEMKLAINFSYCHDFFINWLPKWWKLYPGLKPYVANLLRRMKEEKKLSLIYEDDRKLFKLYCSEE